MRLELPDRFRSEVGDLVQKAPRLSHIRLDRRRRHEPELALRESKVFRKALPALGAPAARLGERLDIVRGEEQSPGRENDVLGVAGVALVDHPEIAATNGNRNLQRELRECSSDTRWDRGIFDVNGIATTNGKVSETEPAQQLWIV